ncbi:hypothetical protein KIW84_031930 [Lathyrus oleraceus]|uniref:Retrotransposon gag domain-containing protein n=1 Tax=Pisum sativum TaxID=3888 RepID=A0A9D4XWQ7_PEA|nr:hypothetical protein KIW84_031930 [Pisum sativum]
MKGPDVRWWESASTLMTNQGVPRDWENSKKTFLDKQAEYAPDEKWKIDQFLFGLRGKIYHSVSQRGFTTYGELLRQCYVAENSLKKVQEEMDQYRSGLKNQGRPGNQ